MNFNKVYDTKGLEVLGSVDEIIQSLNEVMTPFKVDKNVDSYQELLPYVIRSKKIEQYEPGSFFISKRHEYIYYLTQHKNGKERQEKLGCEERFFHNEHKKDANKWFYKIANIIKANSETNVTQDNITQTAFHRLNKFRTLFNISFDDDPNSKEEQSV